MFILFLISLCFIASIYNLVLIANIFRSLFGLAKLSCKGTLVTHTHTVLRSGLEVRFRDVYLY